MRTASQILGAATVALLTFSSCGSDSAAPGATSTEVTATSIETEPTEPTTSTSTSVEEFGATAVWYVDPNERLTEESESVAVLVNRVDCAGGYTGPVSPAEVEINPEQVIITFTVTPLTSGEDQECPGNEEVPVVVELPEAIGDRQLVDGVCLGDDPVADSGPCMRPVRWPRDG